MPVIKAAPQTMVWAFSWWTEIHKPYDGTERRIANLRDPREFYELTYLLGENGLSGEEISDLRRTLFLQAEAVYQVPLRLEAVPVRAAVTATSVQVDSSLADWVAVGQAVWVENRRGQGYATTITDATGHPGVIALTVADSPPVGQTYAAWTTHIYPLESLYLEDGHSLARYGSGAGPFVVRGQRSDFRASWGIGADALTTFDDFTVLDVRPAQEELAQERIVGGFTKHDEGATIALTAHADYAEIGRAHVFHVRGAGERQFWKKFFYAVKGSWKPFLLPTWQRDLVVAIPPGAGTTIVVEDNGDAEVLASSAHLRLQLLLEDGSVEYTEVTNVVDGGDTLTLTVSPAISGDPIERISFLEVVRLADDRVTWDIGKGADTATFQLEALVVQHGADTAEAETSIASSAPVWFIEATVTGATYRYTTAERTISHGGNDYTPVVGGLSNMSISPLGEGTELTLRLPLTDPLVLATAVGPPLRQFDVRVQRLQADAVLWTVWWGEGSGWSIEGDKAVLRVPGMLEDAIAGDLPGLAYRHHCPHKLYDEHCQVDPADFDFETTVSSVDGVEVEVASVDGQPDQWFGQGGTIRRNTDGEEVMIVSQVGTTLTLDRRFRTLDGGDTVTLFAGCAHKPPVCFAKFNNIARYGGFPFRVKANPHFAETLKGL